MLRRLVKDLVEITSLCVKRHTKRFGFALLLICGIATVKFRSSLLGTVDFDSDFPSTRVGGGRCKPSVTPTLMTLPNAQKGFNVDLFPYLDSLCLGQDHINAVNDTEVLMGEFAFVTAFSDNHHRESLAMLRSFQMVWPDEQLLVYNLGINSADVAKIEKEFKFAVIKPFPFNRYPAYVRTLNQYRWKPLVVAEVLTKYHRVVWMDTSMVWDAKPKFIDGHKIKHFRVMMFDDSSHSITAATHPGMFEYLPGDINQFSKVHMLSANLIVITAQKRILSEVIRWWVLCALDRYCMEPKGSQLSCKWKEPQRISYANCHRYDQSAINILLALSNSYNSSLYTADFDFGRIIRI